LLKIRLWFLSILTKWLLCATKYIVFKLRYTIVRASMANVGLLFLDSLVKVGQWSVSEHLSALKHAKSSAETAEQPCLEQQTSRLCNRVILRVDAGANGWFFGGTTGSGLCLARPLLRLWRAVASHPNPWHTANASHTTPDEKCKVSALAVSPAPSRQFRPLWGASNLDRDLRIAPR
jgi:hypothetical protein